MPVSAEMVPGEISKSAKVTEPGRAAQARIKRLIICLNKTKQPLYNLLQCFRVKFDLWKSSKKKFENLTLDNTK